MQKVLHFRRQHHPIRIFLRWIKPAPVARRSQNAVGSTEDSTSDIGKGITKTIRKFAMKDTAKTPMKSITKSPMKGGMEGGMKGGMKGTAKRDRKCHEMCNMMYHKMCDMIRNKIATVHAAAAAFDRAIGARGEKVFHFLFNFFNNICEHEKNILSLRVRKSVLSNYSNESVFFE